MYSWQEEYVAALAEKDATTQLRLVKRALAAIEHRRLSPLESDSEENAAIQYAERVLKIFKKCLSEGYTTAKALRASRP